MVEPESRLTRPPVEVFPLPEVSPVRPPGPVDIRGSGDSTLTFRCIPEIPAISRSRMIISIIGEQTGDYSPQAMPHVELATDKAKAFLLALRDGNRPIEVADNRSAFQVEFAVSEDGPTFTIRKPGQARAFRKFNAGWSFDVKAMAAHLLADLGP
jgi:hypothetical protein